MVRDRERRAREHEMDVSLLRQVGVYRVHSGSGRTYEIDLLVETCSCPDDQNPRTPRPCKHVRRVRLEVLAGLAPRPDGRLPDV